MLCPMHHVGTLVMATHKGEYIGWFDGLFGGGPYKYFEAITMSLDSIDEFLTLECGSVVTLMAHPLY